MAQKIASHNPIAVRYAKQAVVRGYDLSLAEGLDLEKRLASELFRADGQKGSSLKVPRDPLSPAKR
jgi:enoyl-CoA hydratase/carnithine racemase